VIHLSSACVKVAC